MSSRGKTEINGYGARPQATVNKTLMIHFSISAKHYLNNVPKLVLKIKVIHAEYFMKMNAYSLQGRQICISFTGMQMTEVRRPSASTSKVFHKNFQIGVLNTCFEISTLSAQEK